MPTGYSKQTGKNPFKGVKRPPFSKEHREKMSLAKRGIPSYKKGKKMGPNGKKGKHYPHLWGPNSSKWVGGTWKYWRRETLIRDDYTCQICGLRDTEIMDVDHIKPKKSFPELVFELNNLVTLCPNCHRRKTIRNKDYVNQQKEHERP